MSGLGSIQRKLTSTEMKLPGPARTLADPLGGISLHQEQYRQQQQANKNADDLATQQRADELAAAQGPVAMATRAQQSGAVLSADDALNTGSDVSSGAGLIRPARRSYARQILSGG